MFRAAKSFAAVLPRAPFPCPGCGSVRGSVVPIVYGVHSAETEDRARRGLVVLGIATSYERPGWECLVCGAKLR